MQDLHDPANLACHVERGVPNGGGIGFRIENLPTCPLESLTPKTMSKCFSFFTLMAVACFKRSPPGEVRADRWQFLIRSSVLGDRSSVVGSRVDALDDHQAGLPYLSFDPHVTREKLLHYPRVGEQVLGHVRRRDRGGT